MSLFAASGSSSPPSCTAVVGALVMSFLQDPIYEAEAQMLVEPRSGEAVFQQDPTLNVQNLERAIQTEIQVLEGQRVRERVQEDLGLDELPPEVNASAGRLDRRRLGEGAQRGPARRAQILADAYVEAYIVDAARAGGRRPDGGRGAAAGDGRRAAGADRRAPTDASERDARRPAGDVQGAARSAADRRRPDDRRGVGRASRPSCRPIPSSRSRCARRCWPASSACCSGSARPSSSTTSTTRVRTARGRRGAHRPAGPRRRAGRAAAGQPPDRAERTARVRRRDLPRVAHERPVPRARRAAARHPGDQLAARRGQDDDRDEPRRRARPGRSRGRARRRRPAQAAARTRCSPLPPAPG